MGSKCMKFNRWIIEPSMVWKPFPNHQCPMAFTFWTLNSKRIGHILDSGVGGYEVSWSNVDYRVSHSSETIFNAQCPVNFNLLTPKSKGHILDSWGASVWSFIIIGGSHSQLQSGNHTVRKPFSITNVPWPWPLTRKSIGTSLTHGEQVYDVSWS